MLVSPSILTANFINLQTELNKIKSTKLIHLDIMDGHFVPNISFGPHISKIISQYTTQELDIHLMLTDPIKYIETFNFPNTSYITIHYESNNVRETINQIKKLNHKVGLSIKPSTPVSEIINLLPLVDLVLIMSVEPGFGGQSFMPIAVDKIKELSEIRINKNLQYLIEVDGGINLEAAKLVKDAGCDIVVVGSYLFNSSEPKKIIKEIENL